MARRYSYCMIEKIIIVRLGFSTSIPAQVKHFCVCNCVSVDIKATMHGEWALFPETKYIYGSWYQLKLPTHPASRPRGAPCGKYTFYRFYTAPCGPNHTTTSDLGISIHSFFLVPAARSHASVLVCFQFHRTRKAQRVRDLCLVCWGPFQGSFNTPNLGTRPW